MTGKSNIYGAVVLLAAWSWLASAQDLSNQLQIPAQGLLVEVKTNKSIYAVSEPVRVTAILKNSGSTTLFIAKHFSGAAGGVAGFYISVKQWTGRPSEIGCVLARDTFPMPDSRTPEQVLREDFVRLPPGALVGFETQYYGCVVKYPGTYQVTAVYSGRDLGFEKVRQIADKADQIVSGEFHSEPATFRVC